MKYKKQINIIQKCLNINDVQYNEIKNNEVVFYNGPVKMGKQPLVKYNIKLKKFTNICNYYTILMLNDLNSFL